MADFGPLTTILQVYLERLLETLSQLFNSEKTKNYPRVWF